MKKESLWGLTGGLVVGGLLLSGAASAQGSSLECLVSELPIKYRAALMGEEKSGNRLPMAATTYVYIQEKAGSNVYKKVRAFIPITEADMKKAADMERAGALSQFDKHTFCGLVQ